MSCIFYKRGVGRDDTIALPFVTCGGVLVSHSLHGWNLENDNWSWWLIYTFRHRFAPHG